MNLFKEFVRLESAGGVVLFIAAVLALVLENSPWAPVYQHMFALNFGFHLGAFSLVKPLLLWVNDGLMAVFFLLVGLEVKREFLEGELQNKKTALLPAIAAAGGMLVPALCYVWVNIHHPQALRGWAIPTATDIAFSLAVLSLLGKRVPGSLKVFLTALAIFDDIGAILVIAFFYTQHVSGAYLAVSAASVGLLWLFNRCHMVRLAPYLLVGVVLWYAVLKSGVHATIAGVLLALFIPQKHPTQPNLSPLCRLEHALHPWVAFLILPLFSFANAGVSFQGLHAGILLSPVTLGIILGLVIGKQLGIFGATWLGIQVGGLPRPPGMSWQGIYGVSLVAGIGFTMSLFIGMLAFSHVSPLYSTELRLGVLMGSVLSGLLGYCVLRVAFK